LQNLLSKISLNKEAGVDVASALSRNYDKLPKDIRELLFNLPYIDEEKAELMSYGRSAVTSFAHHVTCYFRT
ncbi:MAG: hypothetical protein WAJ93_23580, partial [Candidatus Nitrosopolaris sp.]